jgi:hypothetical protein
MTKIAPVAPRTFQLPQTTAEALQLIVEEPPTPPALALAGDADPHLNVFVVNFDGTGNDRDHVRSVEVETLVARFDRHFAAQETKSFRSLYSPGVYTPASMQAKGHEKGASPDMGVALAEGVMGHGAAKRANEALRVFMDFVKERRAEDPNARFHVHINAFSRGCASALILANRLHAMDASASVLTGRPGNGSFVRTTGVLLDAVTTGVATPLSLAADMMESGVAGAWENRVRKEDLQLPPTAAAFLHLASGRGGEERFSFSIRDLRDPLRPSERAWARGVYSAATEPDGDGLVEYQRLTTLKFPMLSHTDMAGGFPESSASAVVEFAACSYMQSLGLPIRPVKPSQQHMESLKASHWGRREMSDDIVFDWLNNLPRMSHFRAFVAWVDKHVRPPASLSDKEVSKKAQRERRVGATPKKLIPEIPKLLVSQEAKLVRTGSLEPVSPVDGVALSTTTPAMPPEGREQLNEAEQTCRIELVEFQPTADDVAVSSGYYFDRYGFLLRSNHSRVVGAPLRHQAAELVRLNGPVTLVVRQEKAIPVVEGRQLPNAKTTFASMLASARPLAPAARGAAQAELPPTLDGGVLCAPMAPEWQASPVPAPRTQSLRPK